MSLIDNPKFWFGFLALEIGLPLLIPSKRWAGGLMVLVGLLFLGSALGIGDNIGAGSAYVKSHASIIAVSGTAVLIVGIVAVVVRLLRRKRQANAQTTETGKIDELSRQIAELKEDTRHVTRAQRRRFGEAMPRILPELFESPPRCKYHGVMITYGSTVEAQNYAEELSRLFGEHGLTTSKVEEFTHESLNTTGLRVLIADPSKPTSNDQMTMKLLDAADIDYEIEQRTTEFPEITVLRVGVTVSR